ncbi:unnamed protein product [Sympodiomycopsis kandeliae]
MTGQEQRQSSRQSQAKSTEQKLASLPTPSTHQVDGRFQHAQCPTSTQKDLNDQQHQPDTSSGNDRSSLFQCYVYQYLVKRGYKDAAAQYASELAPSVSQDLSVPIESPTGFLFEWWTVSCAIIESLTRPDKWAHPPTYSGQAPENQHAYRREQERNHMPKFSQGQPSSHGWDPSESVRQPAVSSAHHAVDNVPSLVQPLPNSPMPLSNKSHDHQENINASPIYHQPATPPPQTPIATQAPDDVPPKSPEVTPTPTRGKRGKRGRGGTGGGGRKSGQGADGPEPSRRGKKGSRKSSTKADNASQEAQQASLPAPESTISESAPAEPDGSAPQPPDSAEGATVLTHSPATMTETTEAAMQAHQPEWLIPELESFDRPMDELDLLPKYTSPTPQHLSNSSMDLASDDLSNFARFLTSDNNSQDMLVHSHEPEPSIDDALSESLRTFKEQEEEQHHHRIHRQQQQHGSSTSSSVESFLHNFFSTSDAMMAKDSFDVASHEGPLATLPASNYGRESNLEDDNSQHYRHHQVSHTHTSAYDRQGGHYSRSSPAQDHHRLSKSMYDFQNELDISASGPGRGFEGSFSRRRAMTSEDSQRDIHFIDALMGGNSRDDEIDFSQDILQMGQEAQESVRDRFVEKLKRTYESGA